MARGAGVDRIVAVATSAVSEAENSSELGRRVADDLGLELEVIDGEREAYFSFLGAVHGFPIKHGLLLDVGGETLENTATMINAAPVMRPPRSNLDRHDLDGPRTEAGTTVMVCLGPMRCYF